MSPSYISASPALSSLLRLSLPLGFSPSSSPSYLCTLSKGVLAAPAGLSRRKRRDIRTALKRRLWIHTDAHGIMYHSRVLKPCWYNAPEVLHSPFLPDYVSPVMQSTSSLPINIVADIVDHLSHDRDAVKACSLVSSSWVHSRVHLFREISVRSPTDGCRFTQFLSFLDEHPAICGFIRKLQIANAHLHQWQGSRPRLSPSFLVDVLSRLPLTKTIKFCGVSFAGAQQEPVGLGQFKMDCVEFVDVGSPEADTPLDWLRILSIFSDIQKLHLQTEPPGGRSPFPGSASSVLCVSSVKLWGVTRAETLMDVLNKTLSPACLQSLDVTLLTPSHVVAVGSLLQTTAPGAHRVRLDLTKFGIGPHRPESYTTSLYWRPLHLSTCTSLTTLTLAVSLDPDAYLRVSRVCDIFAHLPPNLHHLTISTTGVPRPLYYCLPGQSPSEGAMFMGISGEDFGRIEKVVLARTEKLKTLTFDMGDSVSSALVIESMRRLGQDGVLNALPRP